VGQPFSPVYERVASRLMAIKKSVLIVAAAGNESNRPYYTAPVGNPAACPSIMAVAAVTRDREVAPYSCAAMDEIGQLNLSAPGHQVLSAYSNGGLRRLNGTSMATPHVAAVAALMLEMDPTLSAREVWRALVDGAYNLGNPQDFGAGLVQAP
jgi:subtilisin family serine protease